MVDTRKTVMLARFPGDNKEHPDSSDFLMQTLVHDCHAVRLDRKESVDSCEVRWYECAGEKIGKVVVWYRGDTPITMTRNLCLEHAKQFGVDYVLMLDSDMDPDQAGPGAKRFFPEALRFLYERKAPAIIAAPYCGGGDFHNNVFIFRWEALTNSRETLKLSQYGREESALKQGIEKVAALPTGLMLMDMRVLDRMQTPYFYYEWRGGPAGPCAIKDSTEDVTFTRDVTLAWHDVPDAGCYVHWDSWARHIKPAHVPRPVVTDPSSIGWRFRRVVEGNKPPQDHTVECNMKFPDIESIRQEVCEKVKASFEGNGDGASIDARNFETLMQDEYAHIARKERLDI